MNKISLLLSLFVLSSCGLFQKTPVGPSTPDTVWYAPDSLNAQELDPEAVKSGTFDVVFDLHYTMGTAPEVVAVRVNQQGSEARRGADGSYSFQVTPGPYETTYQLTVGNPSAGQVGAFSQWQLTTPLHITPEENDDLLFDWADFWDGLFTDDLIDDLSGVEEEDEPVDMEEMPDLDGLTFPSPDFYGILEWTETEGIAWMLENMLYQLRVDFESECNALYDEEEAEFTAYLEYCPDEGFLDYSFVPMNSIMNLRFAVYYDELQDELDPYYDETIEYDDMLYDQYTFSYSGREYLVFMGYDPEEDYYNIYFEWE